MDKKKKKPKGPIRIEAIVPITIVIALFALYFKFFLDTHLRWGVEYGATQAYGAEINIGNLQTNFFAPSITLSKIQVTDKGAPELNIVELGEIKLALLWDGLLRGKIVIPESSILGIQAKSKRRRPGRILPPPPPSESSGAVTQAAEKTLSQLQEENQSNLLSDVFAVAGGTNYKDQLKNMEGQLKTKEKVEALQKELKNQEQVWKKRIADLPDENEIKQLVRKIESLKIETQNPAAIQRSLKQIDQVYKEAQQKYKTVEQAKKSLNTDLNQLTGDYKNLEDMIQQDINRVTEKLNIPSLDPQEINKMLLGNLIASQLGELVKYKKMADEYMPAKSAKNKAENQTFTPRERSQGIDFRFPKEKSYPKFWLKTATISSTSKEGRAGDIKGSITNITNNPKHLGIPAKILFEGGFPKEKILNVAGDITIDHTTEKATEFGTISVGSFPVPKKTLTESKDVALGFNQAQGRSSVKFKMADKRVSIASETLFSQVDYFSSASSDLVKRLLRGVTAELQNLDVNVKATGSWDSLSLNINSNLGQKLQQAIKAQVSGEIKRARAQVEKQVRGAINKEKVKLKNELGKLEKSLGISLKSRDDAISSVEQKVQEKKKSITQKEKKKLEEKGKKELKKLLKGIKF